MFTIVWLALQWLVWGIAALYLIMTINIWSATLRTLGLSSLRRCPRVLRLSLRASPIRELSGALLLPFAAILLMSGRGSGSESIVASPLNALLLIAILCFTLFLVPPTALVFSSSTDRQVRWALSLKEFTGGRRVISLLDTGYMAIKPDIGDIWSIASRRSMSLTDVLRTSDMQNWQAGVKELIGITPIVVVDVRVSTSALLFEASTMLSPEHAYKAIFVSEDDGACPVLEKLLDEGLISPDCLVSVVKEAELGQLLRGMAASGDTLPKPCSFALTPSRIGEIAGRRNGAGRQAMYPPAAAKPQESHTARVPVAEDRISLSTSLTPFWRLMAKGLIVQSILSVALGLWIVLASPQPASTSPGPSTVWLLLILNSGACALFFYLAHFLKKVCIGGDSLFVSDGAKECEIHISQISCVTGPDWTTLRRITIHLHQPSVFGEKIVFAGKLFSAGLIARDLRRRLYSHAEERGRAARSEK